VDDWLRYLLLFVAGGVAGVVNVVAGGGSFLTLPALMFLGLPPGIANCTNRVGILLQNVFAVRGFRRHGVVERGAVRWAALPATIGSLIGAWAALEISDDAFRRVVAALIVAISLWTLWSGVSAGAAGDEGRPARRTALVAGAFFVVGIYGGFVQAGVGFFILAATTYAGLDLVRGNAVKVFTVLCLTALPLVIFAWYGRIDWPVGLVLASGTVLGGQLGVRLTVLKGHRWVRAIVTAAAILFAVRLWVSP
jgi:uncharacterized membrane protein YfcA